MTNGDSALTANTCIHHDIPPRVIPVRQSGPNCLHCADLGLRRSHETLLPALSILLPALHIIDSSSSYRTRLPSPHTSRATPKCIQSLPPPSLYLSKLRGGDLVQAEQPAVACAEVQLHVHARVRPSCPGGKAQRALEHDHGGWNRGERDRPHETRTCCPLTSTRPLGKAATSCTSSPRTSGSCVSAAAVTDVNAPIQGWVSAGLSASSAWHGPPTCLRRCR